MRGRVPARDALIEALEIRGGFGTEIHAQPSRAWASATFSGARHLLEIRLPLRAARSFEDGLGEAEFALHGHLIADIAICGRRVDGGTILLDVEALTIEED